MEPGTQDTGIKALQEKIDRWHELRAEIEKHKDAIDELNKQLAPVAGEIIKIMEASDLKRFDGSSGRVQMVTIDYVNNPATEEDKKAFNDHLKSEGIFDEMVSVHHGRLNSYFKEKLAQAEESGTEFFIPGLEIKQRVELRKGR